MSAEETQSYPDLPCEIRSPAALSLVRNYDATSHGPDDGAAAHPRACRYRQQTLLQSHYGCVSVALPCPPGDATFPGGCSNVAFGVTRRGFSQIAAAHIFALSNPAAQKLVMRRGSSTASNTAEFPQRQAASLRRRHGPRPGLSLVAAMIPNAGRESPACSSEFARGGWHLRCLVYLGTGLPQRHAETVGRIALPIPSASRPRAHRLEENAAMSARKLRASLIAVLLAAGSLISGQAGVDQGPKVITQDAQGNEVWQSPDGTDLDGQCANTASMITVAHIGNAVIDYNSGPFPLAPMVVYNCAYMPSICRTIVRFSGTLPSVESPWTYHYDNDGVRNDARRSAACGNYVSRRRADNSRQCPEPNQPAWVGYKRGSKTPYGPYSMELKENVDNDARLVVSYQELSFDAAGTVTTESKFKEYGAKASCDEFPLAS